MAKSNLKVALTGGIASGKSQVSALLEGYGCFIIDLDVIAREVVEPGTAGLNKLIENFSASILLFPIVFLGQGVLEKGIEFLLESTQLPCPVKGGIESEEGERDIGLEAGKPLIRAFEVTFGPGSSL